MVMWVIWTVLSIVPVLAYLSIVYIYTRRDKEGNLIFGKEYTEMKVYSVISLAIIVFILNIRLFF